ncbi:hypothetical protein CEXT_295391 [Caerostris extrusa]|uniref:Ycf15 n=1 Tax=Caerostris extrusa TaxID=172846 RepID=A0AAV4ST64_CAEEX|nr:hypothetical protein CEXT_295391 [Caerostris extrusa]
MKRLFRGRGWSTGDWQEQNQHPNEGNRSDRKLESSLFQPHHPLYQLSHLLFLLALRIQELIEPFSRSTLRHKSPFRPSLHLPSSPPDEKERKRKIIGTKRNKKKKKKKMHKRINPQTRVAMQWYNTKDPHCARFISSKSELVVSEVPCMILGD